MAPRRSRGRRSRRAIATATPDLARLTDRLLATLAQAGCDPEHIDLAASVMLGQRKEGGGVVGWKVRPATTTTPTPMPSAPPMPTPSATAGQCVEVSKPVETSTVEEPVEVPAVEPIGEVLVEEQPAEAVVMETEAETMTVDAGQVEADVTPPVATVEVMAPPTPAPTPLPTRTPRGSRAGRTTRATTPKRPTVEASPLLLGRDAINLIERRLFLAEELVSFDLADWERLCHVLLPDRNPDPEPNVVRITRESWEAAADILSVAQRRAELAEEERRRARGDKIVWPAKDDGPPRWISFDVVEYARLCNIVLPERYGDPATPLLATAAPPGLSSKVKAMASRHEAGESLWHAEDADDVGERSGLRVLHAGNGRKRAATEKGEGGCELVEQVVDGIDWTGQEQARREKAEGFISLGGCIQEAEHEDEDGYFNAARTTEAAAQESGCRRVKEVRD